MKRLVIVCLVLAGCGKLGNQNQPITGLYDVQSEVVGVQCNAASNTPLTSSFTMEVAEEDFEYVLYVCDSSGDRLLRYATSTDGLNYHGSVGFELAECMFVEYFDIHLSFYAHDNTASISGDSLTTLTAGCAEGNCLEKSILSGVKRKYLLTIL